MGHVRVDSQTPFAVSLLFATDEEGRALGVPLVRATHDISPCASAVLAQEQEPPSVAARSASGAIECNCPRSLTRALTWS